MSDSNEYRGCGWERERDFIYSWWTCVFQVPLELIGRLKSSSNDFRGSEGDPQVSQHLQELLRNWKRVIIRGLSRWNRRISRNCVFSMKMNLVSSLSFLLFILTCGGCVFILHFFYSPWQKKKKTELKRMIQSQFVFIPFHGSSSLVMSVVLFSSAS